LNLCVVQPAQSGSSQIWFATDVIRPGVTVLNTGNDYIYNIMAKGYDSLDDWCMSQAQQSTLPAMRNIASWTALIIAQPDWDSTPMSSLSTTGTYRATQYFSLGTLALFDPRQLNTFRNTANNIYDKNGILVGSGGGYYSTWSGLNYNGYWLPYGGSCLAVVDADSCLGLNANYCCSYLTSDQHCSPCGGDLNQYSLNEMIPSLSNTQVSTGPGSNNAWGSNSAVSGVAIFPVTNCNNEPNSNTYVTFGGVGLEFATDCGGGSFYNANGSQQKSILCLGSNAKSVN
jgi:hypothetical protein